MIRDTKQGIKNLAKWFSIIWQDRDWDQSYLYEIIKFKLEQMESYHREHGITLNAYKYADQMRVCVNLLDRLIKDDYAENAFKHHDKKWGDGRLTFNPKFSVEREKAITDKEKAQERKEWNRLYEHSDNLHKQDLDMLFTNMRKHIEGWWD